MADNFGQLQNGRASNGGRFYAVPSVNVTANTIFMPAPASSPLFGIAEYPVAANALGSFASEGVFVFDKPAGWIDDVGKKIFYRPTGSNSGAFVLQEQKGDVLVGFQVLANVPANKLGVLLTTPEFVENILLVTSNADSGAGSLRQAIADAAFGDIIKFDDSLEVDGVIMILLSSQLSIPEKNLTIDGGSHTGSGDTLQTRVILDAQELSRCVQINKAGISININDITFSNGVMNYGAGIQLSSSSTNTLNYCVFDTCKSNTASSGNFAGGAFSTQQCINTFNYCTFKNCFSKNYGGAIACNGTSQTILNNCVFTNNEATTAGATIYAIESSKVIWANCDLLQTTTVTALYLRASTNGGLFTFAGNNLIPYNVYINDNVPVKITGSTTCANLTIQSGAIVSFDGVDSILAVTNNATIGSATFTAAEGSTGYLALPDETTPPTVGTGIKVATYGAGLETFEIDAEGATWTADDLTVPILIEEKSGGTWTTLDAAATGGTYADTFATGDIVRGFDGVRFLVSSLDGY